MRIRFLAAAALLIVCLTPAIAAADATVFLGRNSAGDDRGVVRGIAVGVSLLVVGFEFEYANAGEDATLARPALRTTSGNVFAQTFGLPFQLYATTGAGVYRESISLGNDEETAFALNNGGGVKINLAGPLRARIDYRIFSLRGNPKHKNVQRIYAGLNIAF